MRIWLSGLVVVVSALVGFVVFGANALLNSEMARGRVVAALERAMGHGVRIGGALRVGPGSLVGLAPVISAEDVSVLNGPGFSREALVSVRRVEAVVGLWPLVSGRVEVRSVLVEGPDVLLERDAKGRGNWERAEGPVAVGEPVAAVSRSRMAVEVGPVRIEGGRVAGLGMPVVALGSATVNSAGGVIKVLAQAGVGALPVAGAVEFRRGEDGAGPVVLELTADGGTVRAEGVVGPGGFEGAVSGAVPDVGRTALLLGAGAPALQDVRFSARVGRGVGGGLAVRGMTFTSMQGDVAGDLAVVWAPRVAVRGTLVGKQWTLDDWRFVRPAPVGGAVPPGPVAAPVVAEGGRGLPFGVLRRADGDLQVAVDQISYRGGVYRAMQARAVLQDGLLRLDPVQFASPAGLVQGRLVVEAGMLKAGVVEAGAAPPRVAVVLHAPGLEGAGLAAVAGVAGAVSGTVAVEADLRSAGASWGAIAAGVTGHLAASLQDGEVDNAALGRLFGPVLRSASIPFEASGRSHVRCMAVRMDAEDGQVRVGTLGLDTTRLRLEGEGTVDLGGETMDLHLRPMIRIGGAGISVPVRVVGPIRAPRATADKGVLSPGRFGISIARLGAQLGGAVAGDLCGPER